MKEVLIIEDKEIERKALKQIVSEIDSHARIYEAKDEGEAYVIAMKTTIDVFLVDIILHPEHTGDQAGAEFAQNIRTVEKYRFTPIIIVTSLYDSKMSIFTAVRYYSFIEKPFDFDKVRKTISDAMFYQTENAEDRKYIFHVDGLLHSVKIKDIYYIESRNHRLHVVLEEEQFYIPYKSCKAIMQELDTPDFIRCNRGTIVNVKHIQKVDSVNRFIYFAGMEDRLEIGPVMKKEFLEQFHARIK